MCTMPHFVHPNPHVLSGVLEQLQVNYYARHLQATNEASSALSTAKEEASAGDGLLGASFVFANFNKVQLLLCSLVVCKQSVFLG